MTKRADLTRRWVEAFNVRDMKALDDLIAPDFEFHPYLATLIETSVYRGCDGLRTYFAESDEAWGHLQARLDEVHEVGDRCTISYGELYGKGRASGMEVRVPVAWVAEWRDGKLVRLVSYKDKQQALDAVEAAGVAMSQENVELVRRVFSAFHAGDFERVIEDCVPDIEWDASRAAPDGGIYRGTEEIRAAWARFQRAWEEHRVTVERAFGVGDDVVLVLREYGRGRGTGIEVNMQSADIYSVHVNKVTRVVSYADAATAFRDAGLGADTPPGVVERQQA